MTTVVLGITVDEIAPVQNQHTAFVASDVQQRLQGVDGVLPRVRSAVDPAQFSLEDADLLVDVVGRHFPRVRIGQQLDHLTDERVHNLEYLELSTPGEELGYLVGHMIELAGLLALRFPSPGKVAAVESCHLGAVCHLGSYDLRSEARNGNVLGRGEVHHRRVIAHETIDLGFRSGSDPQVLDVCVAAIGIHTTFRDGNPF
ncbi:hypothetical protein PG999_008311 [Apiospora kogelbergensis]|uniref:Uncharacterized protein n=1 Tax=Apiospora kogelbergensis TaxID=1337665 RepID=A0AAW0QG11_9PEZI